MKRHLSIVALILFAAPAFAQDPEESVLRDLGMGAIFADGNLALRQLQRGDDPVQQLKRFFIEARLPLTSQQERRLEAIVDAQIRRCRPQGRMRTQSAKPIKNSRENQTRCLRRSSAPNCGDIVPSRS